ncbi:MAG: hypothetical protein U5O39_17675 [Gammaproteobacteria bacterium]|nr:hypothetical protein [Gammaproteobacteria bacterium]
MKGCINDYSDMPRLEEWVTGMITQIREVSRTESDHAALAMQAAKKVRRARRRSQKEKMGHEVCHHLLNLLSAEPGPTAREQRFAESIEPARRLDDRQLTMSF